jgi:Spy/CpxP family protein refolding chaperone
MKPSFLLSAAALTVSLVLPLAAGAQQQYPPQQPYPQQGYPQGGYPAQQGQGQPGGPGVKQYNHWMKIMGGLNLTSDQQNQIRNVLTQYAQQHPAGSQPDRKGTRALRQQLYGLLSGPQQAQLNQIMQAQRQQRIERMQQHLQRMQQENQGAPQQQPPVR